MSCSNPRILLWQRVYASIHHLRSHFSSYPETISHLTYPRRTIALGCFSFPFPDPRYLSKRRRDRGKKELSAFPTMIERDFVEIVGVKFKRHAPGKCINPVCTFRTPEKFTFLRCETSISRGPENLLARGISL